METMREKIIEILKECEIEEKNILDDDFMRHGIIESLQVAEIVMGLEEVFDIEINGDDIIPDNFINLEKLEKLVGKYKHMSGNKGGGVQHNRQKIMWNMIASNSSENDVIEQAGWRSALTGKYFSEDEMDEYVENIYLKCRPYISSESTVIEIGIGSGIVARRIAPLVKSYIGADISKRMLEITEERLRKEEITNIKYVETSAIDVDKHIEVTCDIVIMSSVVQYLDDYEEFIEIVQKLCTLVSKGIVFIGDILDADKKDGFLDEIKLFGGKANSDDLWYPRKFMEELIEKIDGIKEIKIGDKCVSTISNELTKYRYDVILSIEHKHKFVEG